MDVTPTSASSDDERLDLTPRTTPAKPARRWWAIAVVIVVLAGLAFVATKALSDATLFFYNADEAVAKKAELGDKRFRLQGTVAGGSVADTGDGVEFMAYYNGVEVPVVHQGDPPELFEEGAPVVVEGRWDPSGEVFSSDRMLVKHDEEYVEVNDERLRDAEEGGQPTSPDSSSSEP
jgi:cytochrome c-type biogenesis protein CcmE